MRRLVQAGIVVVLLLTCAGLLLPNICQVRGAAARMQCSNNCKQLVQAWYHYEGEHDHFLPGTHLNPDLPPEQRLSWVYTLLPYLEQDVIYKSIDRSLAWDSNVNTNAVNKPIRTLICSTAADMHAPRTSYLGMAGVGADAATLPADDPRVGAFGYDRTLRAVNFADGIENTMLLMETRSGGPWAQGGPGTVRGLDPANRPYTGDGRPFDGDHQTGRWWEQKSRTATIAMCDGSVRMVRDSVAAEVLEALATVRGMEVVPGEW
jgi:hypothetical protein